MSIFVDETTKVVIQGVSPTSQGLYHGLRNRAYGTKVVAGTNPKRGGEEIEGIPVFATVRQAVEATGANASFISVPPPFAAEAILEAAAAGVPFVVCITEGIPAQDEALAYNRLVRDFPTTRLLGPNCPGVISPGKCNIGITSGDIAMPGGPVGIVSRSGTLTYQALHELSQQGVGQTTCVGIGGVPGARHELHRLPGRFRGRLRHQGHHDRRRDRRLGRRRSGRVHRDLGVEASGVLRRRGHGPAWPQDGTRRGHHLGLQGHSPGQDGGAFFSRRHRRPQSDRSR